MFTMPSCRNSHGFMGRKKVRLQAFKIHLRVNGYHAKLQRLEWAQHFQCLAQRFDAILPLGGCMAKSDQLALSSFHKAF